MFNEKLTAMKTKIIESKKPTRISASFTESAKSFISLILALCLFTAFSLSSVGQDNPEKKKVGLFNHVKQPPPLVSDIHVVFTGNGAYVEWRIISANEGGDCILQRSDDGVNFDPITVRDFLGTPTPLQIRFSFNDENPLQGKSYYRLVKILEDGTCWYSDPAWVDNDSNNSVLK